MGEEEEEVGFLFYLITHIFVFFSRVFFLYVHFQMIVAERKGNQVDAVTLFMVFVVTVEGFLLYRLLRLITVVVVVVGIISSTSIKKKINKVGNFVNNAPGLTLSLYVCTLFIKNSCSFSFFICCCCCRSAAAAIDPGGGDRIIEELLLLLFGMMRMN